MGWCDASVEVHPIIGGLSLYKLELCWVANIAFISVSSLTTEEDFFLGLRYRSH